jgi:large repetitive protein
MTTLTADSLGSFGRLATAIGILEPSGGANPSWFGDPVGSATATTGNQHGLRHVLSDDDQRAALFDFVDEILGPPEAEEEADETWVPLFAADSPHVTVYAVVSAAAGEVHLGVGLKHETDGGTPSVATSLHVPLFRFARRGSSLPTGTSLPAWLLLGSPGARVGIDVTATLDDAPPAPGVAALAGLSIGLGIPTAAGDDLAVSVVLRGLQLPGASAPETFTLEASSLEDLGTEVLDLMLGLVRAQADALTGLDPALAPFRAVTGLLGLRAVADLPNLPLADLPTRGLSALVGWVEQVLADDAARDAWLGQLADLVGGTLVAAQDAVRVAVGPLEVLVGVRVQAGTGGHPVLVPWVDVGLVTQPGARARLAADLLAADTGTGSVRAVPDVRLEAVFGEDAGGGPLLAGTGPQVGSLHTGVTLDATGRPAFVLTLHDVTVTSGGTPHAVLDLSSPSAALDSASTVLETALANALANLGDAGALLGRLLGLDPPAGIGSLDVPRLFSDPVGAIRAYWAELTASPPAAADVLGRLRALMTGTAVAPVDGLGTEASPWLLEVADGVALTAWRDGDLLAVAAVASVSTTVATEYRTTTSFGVTLLRADLAAGTAAFGPAVTARLALARDDGDTASVPLGALTLEADEVAVEATWTPAHGLRTTIAADGLAVAVADADPVPLPLPTVGPDGRLALPAPDWSAIEPALAALLAELRLPAVDAVLALVGWSGEGAHLPLSGLLGGDPAAAVRTWLADLVLDCERVRLALAPLAALLSGFTRGSPLGIGTARSPFRCPVAGEARAPGLAVWLDPGCRLEPSEQPLPLVALDTAEPPDMDTVAAVLRGTGALLPDVGDLMVGRDSLADGLDVLLARWTGTDGLVGRPAVLPDGVHAVELDGFGYDVLVALGSVGSLLGEVLDPAPTAIVYVGCEASWTTGRAAGAAFDATGPDPAGRVPATGAGTWFVRLPTPGAAAAARPELGGVGEQAARLAAVLAARTDPVVLVGYGAAGAAALRAAATVTAVSDIVTVGTPWAGMAVDSLATGLGGDALRLLDRLRRPDTAPWPDPLLAREATPQQQVQLTVTRSLDILAPGAQLPSAAAEARRAGLGVHAVFGALDADTLAAGIAAQVADGVQARADAASGTATPEVEQTALHAGVDLPVFDLDLDGLLVGVGATLELCRLGRASDGGLEVAAVRGVLVDVHLGVHDGWLVGGPGSGSTVGDVRWMSARVEVPLDGREGDAELVLHEARGFGIDRERWVVRADLSGAAPDVPAADITAAVPEVRVLLSDAVARLRSASADLAALLDLLGLSRNGGLDPDGLDRLLHDAAATVQTAVAASAADLATRLRALVATATGSGAAIGWTSGPATVSADLATGSITGRLRAATPGAPALEIDITAGPSGTALTAAFGTLDPDAGGLRVVASAGTTGAANVALEWAGPGSPPRRVALLPVPDGIGLADLAVVALPALVGQGVLTVLRQSVPNTAAAAVDAAIDAAGLLTPPDALGFRAVAVPIGLIADPGGWFRHATTAWRTDPAGQAVALLDAIAPLVVPTRGTAPGWPVADGVTLAYTVETGARLRLLLDVVLDADLGDGARVTTHLAGGVLVGSDGTVQPTVEVSADVDGRGLQLAVAPETDPPVLLTLVRPAPATPLRLFPGGPGLGQALSAAGEMALPPVLDALAGHRSDAGTSMLKSVGQAVFDLGGALDLRDGTGFSAAKITAFAADPAARLTARLPQLVATGTAALADALDPGHTIVAVVSAPDRTTFMFGAGGVQLILDASGPVPAVELQADLVLDGVGRLGLDRLRLSADGIEVAVTLGPVPLDVEAFTLRPLLTIRAGSAVGSGRLFGLGLALDDAAAQAVEVRWALDAAPPALVAVTRSATGETLGTPAEAAQSLLAIGLSLAGGVAVDALRGVLTANAIGCLQGVVFTDTAGSTAIDPALALDLLDPQALFGRLQRLAWNAAQLPLSLTLDGLATIALAATGTTTKQLGLSLSLAPGRRLVLADGDTKVELEVDASWVDPAVPPGLSIFLLSGSSPTSLDLVPAVSVAGLGLRFTNTSGPLLSLGPVSLDAIAVHVYGEATTAGVGGGANLELAGLAFAPGGGTGGNAVAADIMNDAGQSSPASRPVLAPSLAVQRHPALDPSVSLRGGPPPGPWWVVVQRQLGPLYLERVGLDSVEDAGTVSRVSLLFDGRVSIFGLSAAVDRLSINWTGGDVLDIDSWTVDLMGLAVSADLSGVSLVGGILKTGGPPSTEPVSYVGMLLGRFGTYGLSVFGGYTDDAGNPSFFVFGGINGPIGGPPAFFLTGIGGGLGINRALLVPDDVARFNEFPFIQALDPAASPPADPMAELRKLNVYFPPQRGMFWFAAGISFTSFALVDGVAVVAVTFGNGLDINLLGLARLALPRPQAALVSIELGLLARFSTSEGLFIIRAGLTANSWLLYPEVRLTGGFAFATWWKGPLAGQFVMTLGGYHPDFHRDGYPQVPRLGLEWRVTDDIVIKGASYFALTSEALMVGVDVEATADFGWAWARVAFGAHGIVYFDPFWFEVTVYARISAGVKIKTFLGTISFSITIGARVRVWGPEFSGRATFEVGPCDITVPFGSQGVVEPRVLGWAEFVAKYLEDAGGGRARALSSITGRGTLPAATGGDRAAPTSDGSAERPFEVFAEFELSIVTTVPTAAIDVGLGSGPVRVPVVRSDGLAATLGLKPMRVGNLASTLRVQLFRRDPATGAWAPAPELLAPLAANLAAAAPRPNGSIVGLDSFPIGAWGQPDPAGLPAAPLPTGDVVRAGNVLRLVAEATTLAVGPEIDFYRVQAARRPLPLQATGPARADLLAEAGTVGLPDAATTAAALIAARRQLFAPPPSAVPAGLLATPARSRLARAAYAGEVAAPPLFGTLADGMAPENAADASAARTPAPPGPPPRDLRPPAVVGYLTAGNRAATRAARTTVADRRIKRRVAPTHDSVQARLGAHLPVRLLTVSEPSLEQQGTLAATRVPWTSAVGAARSYALGSGGLDGLVGGLGRGTSPGVGLDADGEQAGTLVAPGEVVVLAMPDAAVDVAGVADGETEGAGARPVLAVTDGSARVTALIGDGSVAFDGVVQGAVPVPAGTALLAVQAEGSATGGDGLAGWHARSRLCSLGSHAALGPGCVLSVEGAPSRTGTVWTTAADLLAYAAAVRTRFSTPVRTLAVVVASADADRLLGLGLELSGARRALDADGAERPPTVLLAGDETTLLYAVEVLAGEAVTVRVLAGGNWRVTAVLGGSADVEEVRRAIVRDGLVATSGRVVAAHGAGCRLRWRAGGGEPVPAVAGGREDA